MKKRNKKDPNNVRLTVDVGGGMVLDTTTGRVEPKCHYQKLNPFDNSLTSPSIRLVPEFNNFDDDYDYDEEDDEEEYDDEEYEEEYEDEEYDEDDDDEEYDECDDEEEYDDEDDE